MSFQPPEIIQQIRAADSRTANAAPRQKRSPAAANPEDASAVFHVCTGNRWMEMGEREAPPNMLFGELWLRNELCILFADTNVGKSVLAVQVANSLSRRSPIRPFALQSRALKVLYIDFELSTQQFCTRYRDGDHNFNFSDNFFRADFNPGAVMPDGCTSFSSSWPVSNIKYCWLTPRF